MTDFNLYARIVNEKVAELIMPDSYGQLTAECPTGRNWYAVKWPLNPHFTGETMITMMIDAGFPVREPVTA